MGFYQHVPRMHKLIEAMGSDAARNKTLVCGAFEDVRIQTIRDCVTEFRKLGNPGDDAYTPQHACANAAASTLEMKFPEAIENDSTTQEGEK